MLESVYEHCLMKEFELRGLKAMNQVLLPLYYKGYSLDKEYKIDILVEENIILEIKSCEVMLPVFTAQLISYLKLSEKPLGFLINFNVPVIKDGLRRLVNNF